MARALLSAVVFALVTLSPDLAAREEPPTAFEQYKQWSVEQGGDKLGRWHEAMERWIAYDWAWEACFNKHGEPDGTVPRLVQVVCLEQLLDRTFSAQE